MTTTTARQASSATRIHADHAVLKHLGDWTEDRAFHVRSRKSTVVLDLRFAGRGRVKDDQAPARPATVRLHGRAAASRVLVRRGGMAELHSLASHARLREAHHIRKIAERGHADAGRHA